MLEEKTSDSMLGAQFRSLHPRIEHPNVQQLNNFYPKCSLLIMYR
jgi:hypothetical protein